LTQTSLSTEAIAEILGYSDTANFRQAFKRWTGESPQQYRRIARLPPDVNRNGANGDFPVSFGYILEHGAWPA
jgi:AraC-like DNA-binding protein